LYSLSIDKIPLFNKTDKKSRPKKESCVDPSSLSFYLPKTKYKLAINSLRPGLFRESNSHKISHPKGSQTCLSKQETRELLAYHTCSIVAWEKDCGQMNLGITRNTTQEVVAVCQKSKGKPSLLSFLLAKVG